MKKKTLILNDEELKENKDEAVVEKKDDLLNLDYLYDCVSPPSELTFNTGINATINFCKYIF